MALWYQPFGAGRLVVLLAGAAFVGPGATARGQFARGVGGVGTIYELGTVTQPGQLRNIGGFMRVSSNPVLDRTRGRPAEPQAPIVIGNPSFGPLGLRRGMSGVATVGTSPGLGTNPWYSSLSGGARRARGTLNARSAEEIAARYPQQPQIGLPPPGMPAWASSPVGGLVLPGVGLSGGGLLAATRAGPTALSASDRFAQQGGTPGEGGPEAAARGEQSSRSDIKRERLEARIRAQAQQARLLFSDRQYLRALEQYSLCQTIGSDWDEVRVGRLAAAIAAGRYNLAASVVTEMAHRGPEVLDAVAELPKMYGVPADWVDHCRRLDEYCSASKKMDQLVLLAVVRWAAGNRAAGLEAIEGAVTQAPSDPIAVGLLEQMRLLALGTAEGGP